MCKLCLSIHSIVIRNESEHCRQMVSLWQIYNGEVKTANSTNLSRILDFYRLWIFNKQEIELDDLYYCLLFQAAGNCGILVHHIA